MEIMNKYTNEELKALALDSLKGDTITSALYAYEDGTFLNPEQYKMLLKGDPKEAKELYKIDNPNLKKSEDVIELKEQVASLEKELADTKKALDAANEQIKKLTAKPPK